MVSTASRRARQLADELGLALETVSGTGPGGRITLGDVESAALDRVGSSVERAPIRPAETRDRASAKALPVPPAPPSRLTAPAQGIAPRFSVTARRTISAGFLLSVAAAPGHSTSKRPTWVPSCSTRRRWRWAGRPWRSRSEP